MCVCVWGGGGGGGGGEGGGASPPQTDADPYYVKDMEHSQL